MSILYIYINATDGKGHITEYSIRNVFKDKNEMINWFTYDYNTEYVNPFKTRFKTLIDDQNLSGNDTVCYYPMASNPVYSLRRSFLYDDEHDTTIDIRHYENEIKSHTHSAKKRTSWESAEKRSKKQGRSHYKTDRSYRRIAMYHNALLNSDKRYSAVDPDDNIPNYCMIPSPTKSSKHSIDGYKSYGKTENNWKNKKIRHQWQYHTGISYAAHHKEINKGCGEDWIAYCENDIVLKEAS